MMLEMFQVPEGYNNLEIMTAPLMLGWIQVAMLAAQLLGSYLTHRAQSKRADNQDDTNDENFGREQAAWDVGQDRRVEKLNAVQGLLQRNQPFLKSGVGAAGGTGPDYTFDPTVLGKMQARQPYPGPRQADPGAGLGTAAVGQGVQGLADALLSGYASKQNQGAPVSGSALGVTGMLSGQSDIDPLTGRPRVIGG